MGRSRGLRGRDWAGEEGVAGGAKAAESKRAHNFASDARTRPRRKQTPEPVFGIIKSVLGFRQFSLRGLDKVRGEWSLVTMAWNLKRMFVLAPA